MTTRLEEDEDRPGCRVMTTLSVSKRTLKAERESRKGVESSQRASKFTHRQDERHKNQEEGVESRRVGCSIGAMPP
jgi:hypothetical protein